MADRGCGKTIYGTAEVCGVARWFCSLECFKVEACPHQQCWCRSRWFDPLFECPKRVVTAYSESWHSDSTGRRHGWDPMEFPCAWPGRYDWDSGVLWWSWVAHDGRIVWGEW